MQESLLTASHLHFYFHSHFHFRVHFLFNINVDSHSNAPFKPPCYLHSLCMSLGNACPLYMFVYVRYCRAHTKEGHNDVHIPEKGWAIQSHFV